MLKLTRTKFALAPTCKTEAQQTFCNNVLENTISFGIGYPGTGKTHGAALAALSLLREGKVLSILVLRPAVAVGREIGYLPGDEQDKIGPYNSHILEILTSMVGDEDIIDSLIEEGVIAFRHVGFLRGSNFNNVVALIDEAQNLTKEELYLLLTRIGDNSKLVLIGDSKQTDIPDSGLEEVIGMIDDLKGVSVTRFTADDCVRHGIVKEIIKRFYEDA